MTERVGRGLAESIRNRAWTHQRYTEAIQPFADRDVIRLATSYLALLDERERYRDALKLIATNQALEPRALATNVLVDAESIALEQPGSEEE
jgi:hypothetical protein